MNTQPTTCQYKLYVDGSPGPKKKDGWAGWGMALMAGDHVLYEACGVTAERIGTDSIELEALIQGLSYLLRLQLPAIVQVYTDNQYVAETVGKLPLLKRNNFRNEKGKTIKNEDRIRFMYELMYEMEMHQRAIVSWVRGHSGNVGNDLADVLSKKAAYQGDVFYRENPLPKTEELS